MQSRAEPSLKSMSLLLLPLSPGTLRVIFERENTIFYLETAWNTLTQQTVIMAKGVAISKTLLKIMKAVSSSNVIKHIASREGNWNLPLSNVKNRGADPTKAKHQHITMLIKFVLFVNNTRYLPGFMTQKYRPTEMKVSNVPTPKFFLPFDP